MINILFTPGSCGEVRAAFLKYCSIQGKVFIESKEDSLQDSNGEEYEKNILPILNSFVLRSKKGVHVCITFIQSTTDSKKIKARLSFLYYNDAIRKFTVHTVFSRFIRKKITGVKQVVSKFERITHTSYENTLHPL